MRLGLSRENGDPGGSRTPNPQIRSLMLYPVELRGHAVLREMLRLANDFILIFSGTTECDAD